MSELVCPDCGHKVSAHNTSCGCEFYPNCKCMMSNFEAAMKAAQRAAAIAHLRMLGMSVKFWANYVRSDTENREWHEQRLGRDIDRVNTAIAAYRAIGILKAPKP